MNVKRPKISDSDETEISFPLLECWNPMTKTATIAAEVNKKRVLCRISMDVLAKRFRAQPDEPMQAVSENRSTIRAAARVLIEKEAFEEDGSIVIRQRDLELAD